jgi:hypothetical protein
MTIKYYLQADVKGKQLAVVDYQETKREKMKLHPGDHAQRTVGRLPCGGRQVSLCAT